MKNDVWFKANRSVIEPFHDHSIKTDANGERVCSYGLSPNGYDLTLSGLKVRDSGHVIDPLNPNNGITEKECPFKVDEKGRKFIDIAPLRMAYGVTSEYIKMPRDVAGYLLPKSTYARCGIHIANPLVDAGFEGNLTVAIFNAEKFPVRVYLEQGFCQFIVHQSQECETDYKEKGGHFFDTRQATLV